MTRLTRCTLALAAMLAAQAPAWAQVLPPEGILAPPAWAWQGQAEQAPQAAELLGEMAWTSSGELVWSAAQDDPTPPTTPRGKWYTAAEWALIGCHALDTAYTQRLIGTGRFHEATPLLGHFQNPGLFVGVKFGIAFGQLKATRTVARNGHPILAAALNAAAGGVMCGAAIHNARLYREDQRQ